MLVRLWQWMLALPLLVRQCWAIAVVLFWGYACLAPSDSGDPFFLNDKLVHVIGNFGVVGSLFIAAFIRRYARLALVVCGYALLIECIQWYLPSRFFSLYDMLANIAGIALALVVIVGLQRLSLAARSR